MQGRVMRPDARGPARVVSRFGGTDPSPMLARLPPSPTRLEGCKSLHNALMAHGRAIRAREPEKKEGPSPDGEGPQASRHAAPTRVRAKPAPQDGDPVASPIRAMPRNTSRETLPHAAGARSRQFRFPRHQRSKAVASSRKHQANRPNRALRRPGRPHVGKRPAQTAIVSLTIAASCLSVNGLARNANWSPAAGRFFSNASSA